MEHFKRKQNKVPMLTARLAHTGLLCFAIQTYFSVIPYDDDDADGCGDAFRSDEWEKVKMKVN